MSADATHPHLRAVDEAFVATGSALPVHLDEPPCPCRFCGEAERLDVDPVGASDQFLFGPDFTIVRKPSGEPEQFTDASVWCQVCDGVAPLLVWNGTAEQNAAMRLATIAAWTEYDTSGRWIGAAQ